MFQKKPLVFYVAHSSHLKIKIHTNTYSTNTPHTQRPTHTHIYTHTGRETPRWWRSLSSGRRMVATITNCILQQQTDSNCMWNMCVTWKICFRENRALLKSRPLELYSLSGGRERQGSGYFQQTVIKSSCKKLFPHYFKQVFFYIICLYCSFPCAPFISHQSSYVSWLSQ